MTSQGKCAAASAIAAALIAVVPATAVAKAKVTKVKTTVAVANPTAAPAGFALQFKLAKGSKLWSVSGAKASGKKGAITLKGAKAVPAGGKGKVTLTTKGAGKPSRWSMAAGACTSKSSGRKRSTALLAVTCKLAATAPGSGSEGSSGGEQGGATQGGSTSTGTTSTGTTPSGTNPSGTTPGLAPSDWFAFAPYTDITFGTPELPASIKQGSGATHSTLAFVLARGGNECVPAWGGDGGRLASGSSAYEKTAISAVKSDVTISFGGAGGNELALACVSVSALKAAYQSVVDTYGVTHLDFDVEGTAASNTTANDNRADAVHQLQAQNPGLKVSYTIQALPNQIEAPAAAVLSGAIAKGVKLSLVNAMAMDYGSGAAPNGATGMGAYATQTGETLKSKLKTLLPGLTDDQLYRLLGVTVMIGQNDEPDEKFRLEDVPTLTDWATQKHIGMVSMWSARRDKACAGGAHPVAPSYDCSSVDQQPWAFAKKLLAFTG